MKNTESVLKFLSEIGLNFYESKVFISVIENIKQTVYEISKSTKISRTNVYRIVERLQKIGLLEETEISGKKYLVPTGDEKLELLVKEQESKSNLLRSALPDIKSLFATKSSLSNPDFEVINYIGYNGVKEVMTNILKTKSTLFCFIARDITEILTEADSITWFGEFMRKNFDIKELITENYWIGIQAAREARSAAMMRTTTKKVARNILDIHFNTYIYNNTLTFISWNKQTMYASEIYSEKHIGLEKQKFEILWNLQ
jgi:predicted transcriptional regulator